MKAKKNIMLMIEEKYLGRFSHVMRMGHAGEEEHGYLNLTQEKVDI